MKTRLLLSALLVAGTAGVASAEGDVGDPLTMNSLTPVSTFGVELGLPLWDTDDNESLTTLGINLFGHYVDQGSGLGGYVTLPLSYVSHTIDALNIDENEFSIGNVELGGMFSKWFAQGKVAVIAHVGIALPTTSSENPTLSNPLAAGVYSPLASAPRYTDLVDRIHDSTWLRLGASPMGRVGKIFWRADLGIDVALDEDNDPTLSPAFYVNVGGGVDLGPASVQLELDTLITDSEGDDTNTVLALGARFNSGKLRPGVALLLPLGWDDTFDWNYGVGVSLLSRL